MKRILAWLSLLLVVLWCAFVAYVNVDAIVGAFGDGPPYYGRTTNMDKWENPIPMLIGIDLVTLLGSVGVVWLARRTLRR